VCYDHLAGELGVFVYDQLVQAGSFTFGADGVQLPSAGHRIVHALGVDLAALTGKRRAFCRTCVDWSERRHHLAGALGGALLARFEELGWARRSKDSRVMPFTAMGEKNLRAWATGAGVGAGA
jgi:hypothetical protein